MSSDAIPADEAIEQNRPYQALLSHAEQNGIVLHRANIYGSGPPVDEVSEEILDYVLRHVGASVLDIGCGVGPYVARLNEAGKRCVGIEIDVDMVGVAKGLGRAVDQMSAYALSFPANTFDSVIFIETLEHLEDYQRALAEAARVARSSIVVTVPDISVLPQMSTRGIVPWHILELSHVNFFTPELLKSILLPYANSCEVSRLGRFMEIDGEAMHVHAVATAHL